LIPATPNAKATLAGLRAVGLDLADTSHTLLATMTTTPGWSRG
jgi:hypothetical protein